MGPIGVFIDEVQGRVTRPLMVLSADGRSWDYYNSTNFFVDPITLTGMIRPYCLTTTWQTNAAGNYARLRIGDYQTLAGAALSATDWIENEPRVAGDAYLENRGTNNTVYTSASWGVNRGFTISFLDLCVFGTRHGNGYHAERSDGCHGAEWTDAGA